MKARLLQVCLMLTVMAVINPKSMPFPWLEFGANLLGQGLLQGGAGAMQQAQNMQMAAWQNQKNLEFWRMNNDYNSPAAQRQRMEDAGFNPNLFYGQGSPGNASAPSAAGAPAGNYQGLSDIYAKALNSELLRSQIDLTRTKVDESGVKQDLMRAQRDLAKANPYMKEEYISAMVTQLASAARLKEQEANFMLEKVKDAGRPTLDRSSEQSIGYIKMDKELQLMFQRFDLGTADAQIKAKVVESKEFQNALQELQVKWMKEGDITPQHIYQGIMLLLSRLMR